MKIKRTSKLFVISSMLLLSVLVGIFGLSAKQAFAKNYSIFPFTELEGIPSEVTVGDSGKVTYKFDDIMGVKVGGTVDLGSLNKDLLSLDDAGNWKALKPGKTQISMFATLSDQSFKDLEAKYPGSTFSLEEITQATEVTIKAPNEGINRLYNANSGEHFYTKSNDEKNNLVTAGWKDEDIAWQAPSEGAPVYRVYNPNAGDHHYTTSQAEVNSLVAAGWKDEGISFYSADSNAKKVYRLYNSNAKSGAHHYTMNEGEKDSLIKVGWKDEGISFYEFAIK